MHGIKAGNIKGLRISKLECWIIDCWYIEYCQKKRHNQSLNHSKTCLKLPLTDSQKIRYVCMCGRIIPEFLQLQLHDWPTPLSARPYKKGDVAFKYFYSFILRSMFRVFTPKDVNVASMPSFLTQMTISLSFYIKKF